MPECCADRGCALPTADTQGLHPLYKSGAPRRSYLRQRQPSVDPALREYPCFPLQSSFAFPEHRATVLRRLSVPVPLHADARIVRSVGCAGGVRREHITGYRKRDPRDRQAAESLVTSKAEPPERREA